MSEARTASWSGLCPRPFPMKETRRATRVPLLRSPWWYPQTMRGRASRPRRALRPGIWDHRRDFRARGGSGLYRAASTMELSKPLALGGASANYVTSPLYQIADRGQTGFAPICIRGGCDCAHCRHLDTRCPHMPCRNSAGSVDVRNRRRRGIVYCGRTFAVFVHQGRPRDVSSVKTSSRDDLRRAPVFAGVRRRSRSDRAPSAADAVCDVPANSCRKNWELTE